MKIIKSLYLNEQELSYRKQIARQLRTQYVEGAIFNDLERPLTWFSRSRQSLTLNISQTATDTATVTIEGE